MAEHTGNRHAAAVADLLRLNDAAYRRLLDALDRRVGEGEDAGAGKRRDRRFGYHCSDGLIAMMQFDAKRRLTCLVRPRNLSRSGIGFFHGQFVHSGTRCVIKLKALDGAAVPVAGVVRFCRHIFRQIHEIGMQFAEPIEVDRFVADAAPQKPRTSNRPALSGHVLCLSADDAARAAVRAQAQARGLSVSEAGDAPEGLDLLRATSFAAVLSSLNLPSMPGDELLDALRDEGHAGPVAVWSEAGDAAAASDCVLLGLPLTEQTLDEALDAMLLGAPAADGTLASERWADASARPLVLLFLNRLEKQAARLAEFTDPAASVEPLTVCLRQIRVAATSYGYPAISRLADQLLAALTASPLPDLDDPLQGLVRLCQQACAFRGSDEAQAFRDKEFAPA